MGTLLLPLILGVASYFLTGWARRYAIANKVFDIPGERSSHSIPTPRGGGLAITVCILAVLPFMDIKHHWVLWCTLAFLALLSYIDDHRGLGFRVRLLAQLACACVLVIFVSDFGRFPILVGGAPYVVSWALILLVVLGVVWVTNLYNFMDGIDGIAAVEAIFVSLSLAGMYAYCGEYEWGFLNFTVVASCLGFLFWNWAPAKIFMGDIGSITLGWLFGAGGIISAQGTQVGVCVYLILMGAFIADATYTLLTRLLGGEKVWLPHRSHLYQLLSVLFQDHRKVNYLLIFINVVWLLPMALCALMMPDWALGFVVAAYSPLLLVCAATRGQLIRNSKAEEC